MSIEKWYSTQTAQVLDLVGDYAGRELFLLDGDALVLDCVDDIALDFDGGLSFNRVTVSELTRVSRWDSATPRCVECREISLSIEPLQVCLSHCLLQWYSDIIAPYPSGVEG